MGRKGRRGGSKENWDSVIEEDIKKKGKLGRKQKSWPWIRKIGRNWSYENM